MMLSPLKRKLAHRKSPYKSPRKSPHKNKTVNSPSLQKTLLKKRKSRVSLLFQKVDEDLSKPLTSGSGANCENEEPIPAKRPRRRSSPERVKVQRLPQDLRIGNKLIVKSSVPFTFTPNIPQTTYEQTVRLNKTAAQEYLKNPKVSTNPEVVLQASCLYWKYPYSSILKFPRLEGTSGLLRTEKRSYNPISRETVALTATLWRDAFEDLYCQWKDYDLTAFYVCSNSFTVLFIKSQKTEVTTTEEEDPGETSCMGFNEFIQYKAIITPSTRSLRKLLEDSDIAYIKVFSSGPEEINESLVSMNDSMTQDSLDVSSFSLQSQRTERARTPDQSFQVLKAVNREEEYVSPMKLGEDVANDDFLRQLGLSPSVMVKNETRDSQSCSQFSMECNSQDSLKLAAGTTLVLSDVNSIDAFRSLLCNNKTGWVRSGPEAGLPPTLISTEQFMNASLTSLEIRTQKLRKEKHQYVIEIQNGPILPHLPRMVYEYLENSGQFKDENVIHFHVNGRTIYDGLNEGFSDGMKNINNFSYNPKESLFEY